jgi:acetolactate synthase-1/2/3 large subunit
MKNNRETPMMSIPEGNLEGKLVDADEGHELILQALAANGVECLFYCGGTDNFMFMESVKKFEALKRPHPKLYTCLHESAAVYAAYGYYMVTRKPQAVVLHVDCGTLNAGGAWVNSWHGNAGIVVMAGRAPWTSQGEMPGSRNGPVYYTQETRDQGSIVRQYVKWDFELKTAKNAGLVMQRAFRIASSEPCGPVYITLPRETLMEKIDGGKGLVYGPETHAPAISPQGDMDALRAAAKILVEAKAPVISVKRMGRHPEAVKSLIDFAEKLSIPVIHNETTFLNFPFDHPLMVPGSQVQSYIEKSDALLFIDQIVPWTPSTCTPPRNCRIITMDIDPMRMAQPTWDFPVHLPITCDSSKALPVLSEMAEEFITSERKAAFRARGEEMAARARTNSAASAAAVEKGRSSRTITPVWLGACVNEIVDDKTIVVQGIASGISPGPKSRPGQYFGLPASSLGWAMPAGIGAKLAAPDKTVISASGDGSTVFANPEACLWMERRYKIPTLHIVTNNSRYAAVSYSLLRTYSEGYCVTEKDFNGFDLSPSIDFSMVAKSCGAFGEKVESPAELPGALRRALQAVHSGQGAVLDVALPPTDSR